jgi:tRNA pseudouridine38-40 synthase
MTFIRFTLVGQSFIYHQIRKMIGLLIKICYEGLKGEETIKQAFEKERFDVYLAPGEGLYLNRMTFEGYNKRKNADMKGELKVELDEEDEARITKYRNYLESKILSHEINEQVFTNWLVNHNNHLKEDESEEEKSVNND